MKNKGLLSSSFMFLRHNLRITWRNLWKNKTTTAINVLGLAIGIGSFLAICSIVTYELSFDRHIPDQDRVFRVTTEFKGVFKGTNRGGSTAMPEYLRASAPQIEVLSLFHNWGAKVKIPKVDQAIVKLDRTADIVFADSAYFEVIDQYEWIAGSANSSLKAPFNVVLTSERSRIYFPGTAFRDMIGRKIIYQDSLEVNVSGIVRRSDATSDFIFTDFISIGTIEKSWLKEKFRKNDWLSVSSSDQTFIRVHPETSNEELEAMMSTLNEEAASRDQSKNWVTSYNLQSLSDIHFNTLLNIFDNRSSAAHLPSLRILLAVSFALLVIAIFNFINLETAQATSKSREVGLRKVMGSTKKALLGRFLTESFLISFLAIFIAIPIAYWGLIYFKDFVPEGVSLEFDHLAFWLFLVGLVFGVGLLAGLYPSFVISSFSPIQTLKSKALVTNKGQKGTLTRKLLISFQFVFSQLLIVSTLAVVFQISFMLEKDLGFEKENIVNMEIPWYESPEKEELLYNELQGLACVSTVSRLQRPPASTGYSTSTMEFKKDTSTINASVHRKWGDENYIQLYGIELLAGRNVKKNEAVQESLINETYCKQLGFQHPSEALGATLTNGEEKYEVVGVVKDFHFQALRHNIEAIMINHTEGGDGNVGMKITAHDLQKTIDELSAVWESIYPESPMELTFMDETIERFYKTERQTSKLASTATLIAIFISSLGLFGLISYVISSRTKEVGIRKVLGATVMQIGAIISKEFVFLIGISFLLATPMAYYFINEWINAFAYRVTISWWIYLVGGVGSLLIALITVGTRVWKAAIANPVDSLRYE